MIKQTAFKLITTLALLASIGGCTINSKEQTKQAQTATSSSTKEDIEVIKPKQLAYLKEHEQEMTAYVKAHNANTVSYTHLSYGGHKGRSLTDTVQHFHDKLLLLKDEMNTETAKQMAESRHQFLITFLKELEKELD